MRRLTGRMSNPFKPLTLQVWRSEKGGEKWECRSWLCRTGGWKDEGSTIWICGGVGLSSEKHKMILLTIKVNWRSCLPSEVDEGCMILPLQRTLKSCFSFILQWAWSWRRNGSGGSKIFFPSLPPFFFFFCTLTAPMTLVTRPLLWSQT